MYMMKQSVQVTSWRDRICPAWLIRPTRKGFLGFTCARTAVDLVTGSHEPRVVALGLGSVVSVLYWNEAVRAGMVVGGVAMNGLLPVRPLDMSQGQNDNKFYNLVFHKVIRADKT